MYFFIHLIHLLQNVASGYIQISSEDSSVDSTMVSLSVVLYLQFLLQTLKTQGSINVSQVLKTQFAFNHITILETNDCFWRFDIALKLGL